MSRKVKETPMRVLSALILSTALALPIVALLAIIVVMALIGRL